KKGLVREARKKELDLSGIPDEYKEIFKYGLALNPDDRVSVKDLLGMIVSPGSYKGKGSTNTNSNASSHTSANTNAGASSTAQSDSQRDSGSAQQDGGVEIKRNTGGGGGFKDVAGMDKLKQELTNRVIWIIKDKEKAEKYRITPPNGMLLYGPPGCGKTFFAEKFAEESGFNYMLVNGSDLGSTYIHGTQGKIAELFKKAKANAPIIVCFDEFDSFVPSRQSRSAEHRAEEINEFLAQLNNCSKHGIFVIGTTNLKEMIDPAILRKGRLDLQYEIPAPDLTTRHAMFKIHLKGRPLSEDISIDELAQKTEGYASSDIAFIVNEAAMMAALADRKIEHQDIINSINCNPSSLKTNARAKVGYK
ncbi:MAG: ATP-binding protein, partial [Paludibacteraceae bacterium]|nr:ATP-binding protein [Paludibacteraceae bacterium]